MKQTMYILRVQQPDGSWEFDMDSPMMTRKEAEREAKLNRILGGILCQVWTEEEAASIVNRASPKDTP